MTSQSVMPVDCEKISGKALEQDEARGAPCTSLGIQLMTRCHQHMQLSSSSNELNGSRFFLHNLSIPNVIHQFQIDHKIFQFKLWNYKITRYSRKFLLALIRHYFHIQALYYIYCNVRIYILGSFLGLKVYI